MGLSIPCIPTGQALPQGEGTQVSVSAGPQSGGETPHGTFVISITPEDSPITIQIGPEPPFIFPAVNWEWVINALFGKSHIQLEKDEIQKFFTPVFVYAHEHYGFPLIDGHAVQFKSDGVR